MTVTAVQSLAQLATTFPGILDLAGRVNGRTLTEYRRDVSHYLRFCHGEGRDSGEPHSLRAWRVDMAEKTRLSPNTINRRLAAVKRIIRATAMLGELPLDIAHGFSLSSPCRSRLYARGYAQTSASQ